jgi:Domain of unknown function (DUF4390)
MRLHPVAALGSRPWTCHGVHRLTLLVLAGALLAAGPADGADLKIGTVTVFLNDSDVTVHVVLLGALPSSLQESLHSGIPVHVRFSVELRQQRTFRDPVVQQRSIERQVSYNVLTKEYKVASVTGERREPYVTKQLREAQRVVSDLRVAQLFPGAQLDTRELYYVRVRAEAALGGVNTWVARFAGDAEETSWVRSALLTLQRRQ